MSPSGRSESPLLVLVDESFKPTSPSDHEDAKKKDEEEEEETSESHSPTSSSREGEGEVGTRYPRRVRHTLIDWWLNHILSQQEVKQANVVNLEDPFSLCEALQSKYASKWEAAMQEEYNFLMANGTWELVFLLKGSQDR